MKRPSTIDMSRVVITSVPGAPPIERWIEKEFERLYKKTYGVTVKMSIDENHTSHE